MRAATSLVLAVGLVVDDAIVVVENVCRYMREGMGRVEAALTSSRQLFAPIVAMTITLAAVYAPIGFLSGLTGVLFKEFVFTLAIAVIMSGVVAVTLSPIMSAYMAPESGREGRFTRIAQVGRLEHLLHAATPQTLGEDFRARLQTLWPEHRANLLRALEARMRDRTATLQSRLDERADGRAGIGIVVQLAGAGHLAFATQPRRVADEVCRFLQE